MNKKLLYTLFTLSFFFFSNAQTYILDSTFGTTATGLTEFNPGILAPDHLNAAAKTPDGNTVITGYTDVGNRKQFVIAKVTNTGYDNSFGSPNNWSGWIEPGWVNTGITTPVFDYDWYSIKGEGKDIVVQPDGKIIAVGWQEYATGISMVVTRLNTDGSLDNSFNSSGIKKIIINNDDYANAVALQSDGKIVVGGYTKNGNTYEAIVVRLNNDGSLDTTFDTDGIKIISTGNNDDRINDIAIQTDGKIITCGKNAAYGSTLDFMTIRLNSNGSFDTSFNATGIAFTNFGTDTDQATCLTIQSDNKILVGGYSYYNISGTFSDNFVIARYNTDGTLDTTFSGDGKYGIGSSTNADILNSISIYGSRIYLGGYSYVNTTNQNDFFIVALTFSGVRDTTYNSGLGYYFYNTGFDDYGTSFVQQATNLYLFGTSNNKYSSLNLSNLNKLYDNSFYSSSYTLDMVNNINNIYTYSRNTNYENNILAKYNFNGSIDPTFNAIGYTQTDLENSLFDYCKIATTTDNKILASGNEFLYRFNSNGTKDNTFGTNGKIPVTNFWTEDIIALNNLNFYLIGDINNTITVHRYNSNGTLDNTFSQDGILQTNVFDSANSLCAIIDSNNNLFVGGASESYSPYSQYITLIKYNQNGDLDTSFGNNGIVTNNLNSSAGYLSSIKIDINNKITCVGNSRNGSINNFTLLRFNTDGTLDTGFGNNGVTTSQIDSKGSVSRDLTILNDGKIIVVGSSFDNAWEYLTLARYNSDGTLDTTFANNGFFQDFPDGFSEYSGMKINLEADEKITVLANSYNGFRTNTTLVRYILDLNLGEVDFAETNNQSYIYPNPIGEETNLVYTLNKETSITVELFDLQGKLLKTYFNNEPQSIGKHDEKIILPNYLQTGNYILKVSSPEGSNSIKLIKK